MLRNYPLSLIVIFIAFYVGLQGMVNQFSPSVIQTSNSVEQTDNVK